MDTVWVEAESIDPDGDRLYLHYLVDPVSSRCFATIGVPRDGRILYSTDLRVDGRDHVYTTLEAAKQYCESMADKSDIEDAQRVEEQLLKNRKAKSESHAKVDK